MTAVAGALVRNDHEVDTGPDPEQLAGQVRQGADRSAEIELAGIGARIGDKLLRRLDLQSRGHNQSKRSACQQGDRDEIPARIVTGILSEQRTGDERGDAADEQRMTIGFGGGGGPRPDCAAGARPVVDDHLLAERGRQPLCRQPGHDVDRPAGRKRHDQPDRLGGIGLCAGRQAGGERQCGDCNPRLAHSCHVGSPGRPAPCDAMLAPPTASSAPRRASCHARES